MKDILLIGGPTTLTGVDRIDDDLLSILSAKGLYDRKAVVVWPTESFLAKPEEPKVLADACSMELAELIAVYERKLIPFGGVTTAKYRELAAEVRKDDELMDAAIDICARSQAYAALSRLLLAVTGGQNLVVVIPGSATTKAVSWLTYPSRFGIGQGQHVKAYKSSDSGYGVLNAVSDWPLAFYGPAAGTVNAGELVPQKTFTFNDEEIFYDPNSYMGVENALTADMEVSFPMTDRFSTARAIKVSNEKGYMLVIPPPAKLKNFIIGLKTGKAVRTETVKAVEPKPKISTSEEYVTVKQAAEILKCSDKTIRNYYGDGRLSYKKIGQRKVLILRSSLDALLKNK